MAPATTRASQLACPPLPWPRPPALAELALSWPSLAPKHPCALPRYFSFRFVRLSSVFLFSACFFVGFSVFEGLFFVFHFF